LQQKFEQTLPSDLENNNELRFAKLAYSITTKMMRESRGALNIGTSEIDCLTRNDYSYLLNTCNSRGFRKRFCNQNDSLKCCFNLFSGEELFVGKSLLKASVSEKSALN
jgi:hypothetical protein